MNFLRGGDLHTNADQTTGFRTPDSRSADADNCSPDGALVAAPPGDQRGFVHKRIFGGIKGAIGGILKGGLGGGISGLLGGIVGGGRPVSRTIVPQVDPCPPGFFIGAGGQCVPRSVPGGRLISGGRIVEEQLPARLFPTPPTPPGARPLALPARAVGVTGEAVLGQFGAGFEPEVFDTMVRRCPRGAVLGSDGVCYNRRDLRNDERFWPRGRRPLLTGGEMRAISTASSAAKKLQRKQKQLQQLGLLKKPATRSRPALPPGHRAELRHASSHD